MTFLLKCYYVFSSWISSDFKVVKSHQLGVSDGYLVKSMPFLNKNSCLNYSKMNRLIFTKKNTGLILVNHTRGTENNKLAKYKQWLQLAKWEEWLCKGNGNVTVSLITSTLFLLISGNLLHLLLSKQHIKNVLFVSLLAE